MRSELRQCNEQLRQIEAYNRSAMERASREIQHDNYRLARELHEFGFITDEEWEGSQWDISYALTLATA